VDTNELQEIIENHKKWLNDGNGREKADLHEADLRGAYLHGANLSRADLRWSDLREADLTGADLSRAALTGAALSRADLSRADLSRADLREADLREADLRGADLSGADLRWSDLREANLSRAALTGADLSGAIGNQFVTFQAGKHYAIFTSGYGHIGCERYTYDEWIKNYREIGWKNDYSDADIERYRKLIEIAVEYLKEIESKEES